MSRLLLTVLAFTAIAGAVVDAQGVPAPVPQSVRDSFQLAPFYQKWIDVGGFPIVGSAKVSDAALSECEWIVKQLLGKRPDILKALAEAKVRFAVMAYNEYTTDIPEHAHLRPRVYWDRRARGLGATPSALAVSGAEENLLSFPGDPYPREIISIHEFSHAIQEMGMRTVDPTFDGRLKAAYEAAIAAGLWKGTYAAVNRNEYWAESAQAWFDNNDANNALHNDISTRAKLKTYDPTIAGLCAEVFGDGPWRYQKPADRSQEDRAHLAGFASSNAPRFQWRQEPVPDRPRVAFQCEAGEVEFEFSGPSEKLGQFLAQIQEGYYSGGRATLETHELRLTPAENTPDGAPIPGGEGGWKIQIGDPADGVISAKINKGGAVLTQIARDAGNDGVHVQRIVRLN
jgi:hypothetical protein